MKVGHQVIRYRQVMLWAVSLTALLLTWWHSHTTKHALALRVDTYENIVKAIESGQLHPNTRDGLGAVKIPLELLQNSPLPVGEKVYVGTFEGDENKHRRAYLFPEFITERQGNVTEAAGYLYVPGPLPIPDHGINCWISFGEAAPTPAEVSLSMPAEDRQDSSFSTSFFGCEFLPAIPHGTGNERFDHWHFAEPYYSD